MKTKLITILLLLLTLSLPTLVYADTTQTAIGNGINYLGTNLVGPTGQIGGGSTGDASPWAAIALAAEGVDPSTVKTSTNAPSLVDYLKNNHPTTTSVATEWEKWILAIMASGQNPYSFGGTNYVLTLESNYYSSNQIGDSTSLTDDWFGVLALISSGVSNTDPVLTHSLSFILSHQNSDGGFGYSTTAASDGNDTAAAIQALVAAKNAGVNTTSNLDDAISKAKTYLLTTQAQNGGFLYDTNSWTTAPDSDSTTWGLMALNVLGLGSSTQAASAKQWLISQQSTTDQGFTACQYNPPDYACQMASNSTTTAHAIIGLLGRGWMIKTFDTNLNTSSAVPASPLVVTPSKINSLLATGSFTIPATASATLTPYVTAASQVTINLTKDGGKSSVVLPAGTAITRSDGVSFSTDDLSMTAVSTSALSGFSSGFTVNAALQWGIPNIGVTFSAPIALNIFVGTSFNNQTLNVLRSTSTSSGWTSDGLVSSTCVVVSGLCSFQTTKASYFVTTQSSTTSSTSSSSSSSNSASSPSPTPSPTPTPQPSSVTFSPTQLTKNTNDLENSPFPLSSPSPEVLGVKTTDQSNYHLLQPELVKLLLLFAAIFLGLHMYNIYTKSQVKRYEKDFS